MAGLAVLAAGAGALLTAGIIAAGGNPFAGSPKGRSASSMSPTTASSNPAIAADPPVKVSHAVHALIQRLEPGLVAVDVDGRAGTRQGTGFVYQPNGMILTSLRLVTGATTITVTAHGGQQWNANVVGTDRASEVALLQVPATHMPALRLGVSQSVQLGELVVAVGMGNHPGSTLQVGIMGVAALHQQVDIGGTSYAGALETDTAPSDPLGAVVLDSDGRVLGVMEARLGGSGGNRGVAIPINTVQAAADQLVAGGPVVHAWLGVDGANLPPAQARRLKLRGAALIRAVTPDSPAARAGIRPGDIVVTMAGSRVASMTSLELILASVRPGSKTSVVLIRSHKTLTLPVTLSGRPG